MICKSLFGGWGADWYAKHALWRWKPHQNLKDGGINSSARNAPKRLAQPLKPADPRPQTATGPSFPSKTDTAVLV